MPKKRTLSGSDIKQKEKQYVMQSYARYDLVLDHGKGCLVYDTNGKEYLDCLGGIACIPVGHANPRVSKAISDQAKKLIHVSNLFYTEQQVILAEKVSKLSGLSKCFFCNSGAEANEAAIKLAKKVTGKRQFIVFDHSFHGRTHATLAATWKEKIKTPFLPLVDGFTFVAYNDIAALDKAITADTAAVMIEPIQGESGVLVPFKGYLKEVSDLCRRKNVLLIVDEVQTGNGRTGKYFAYQHEGFIPDIVTTAKGLANGAAIGVCISNYEFGSGEHGSTFGGNNLACAAANATIDEIIDKKLMKNAEVVGDYLMKKAKAMGSVKDVRGKGLLVGIEVFKDARAVVEGCMRKGLIINNATDSTLRFAPPLTITKKQIDKALKILAGVLAQ